MRIGAAQGAEWQTMKLLALEFSERLASHAQKEDGALLPALENLLDEETDRELFGAYASGSGMMSGATFGRLAGTAAANAALAR